MDLSALKVNRRNFPALLIVLYCIILGNSYDVKQLLNYAPLGLVALILIGGFYETSDFRKFIFKKDKKEVEDYLIDNFKALLKNNKIEVASFNNSEIEEVFWSIVDNNVTLSKKSVLVMANGLYLSSFQDTILISILFEIIAIILMFIKGDAYIIYVFGFGVPIILSLFAKDKTIRNHEKLIMIQLKFIRLCLRANPVKNIINFLPSLYNGVDHRSEL